MSPREQHPVLRKNRSKSELAVDKQGNKRSVADTVFRGAELSTREKTAGDKKLSLQSSASEQQRRTQKHFYLQKESIDDT